MVGSSQNVDFTTADGQTYSNQLPQQFNSLGSQQNDLFRPVFSPLQAWTHGMPQNNNGFVNEYQPMPQLQSGLEYSAPNPQHISMDAPPNSLEQPWNGDGLGGGLRANTATPSSHLRQQQNTLAVKTNGNLKSSEDLDSNNQWNALNKPSKASSSNVDSNHGQMTDGPTMSSKAASMKAKLLANQLQRRGKTASPSIEPNSTNIAAVVQQLETEVPSSISLENKEELPNRESRTVSELIAETRARIMHLSQQPSPSSSKPTNNDVLGIRDVVPKSADQGTAVNLPGLLEATNISLLRHSSVESGEILATSDIRPETQPRSSVPGIAESTSYSQLIAGGQVSAKTVNGGNREDKHRSMDKLSETTSLPVAVPIANTNGHGAEIPRNHEPAAAPHEMAYLRMESERSSVANEGPPNSNGQLTGVPIDQNFTPHSSGVIEEWLQITGFYDADFREETLIYHRTIAELDAKKAEVARQLQEVNERRILRGQSVIPSTISTPKPTAGSMQPPPVPSIQSSLSQSQGANPLIEVDPNTSSKATPTRKMGTNDTTSKKRGLVDQDNGIASTTSTSAKAPRLGSGTSSPSATRKPDDCATMDPRSRSVDIKASESDSGVSIRGSVRRSSDETTGRRKENATKLTSKRDDYTRLSSISPRPHSRTLSDGRRSSVGDDRSSRGLAQERYHKNNERDRSHTYVESSKRETRGRDSYSPDSYIPVSYKEPGYRKRPKYGMQVNSDFLELDQPGNRYFAVKSSNEAGIDNSQIDGIWMTHKKVRSDLEKAYRESRNVILFFSAYGGSGFRGYAKMVSEPDSVQPPTWTAASSDRDVCAFRIKWINISVNRFTRLTGIRNAFEKNEPVYESRNWQEIDAENGAALCQFCDRTADWQTKRGW